MFLFSFHEYLQSSGHSILQKLDAKAPLLFYCCCFQLIKLVKQLKEPVKYCHNNGELSNFNTNKVDIRLVTPTVMSVLFCTDPLYQPQHLRPPLVSPHILNPLVSFAAVHLSAKYLLY